MELIPYAIDVDWHACDSYFDVKVVLNCALKTESRPCNYNSRRGKFHLQGAYMAGIKLVVLYPRPKDVDAFEKVYQDEHVPMAVQKLEGKTRLVATRVTASPQGTPAFHRIAEIHFPSMEALQACVNSPGGKETVAHAIKISSGGPPVMLIAEEQSFSF
jgi:uncharacterized protein (TIGR02118 family)